MKITVNIYPPDEKRNNARPYAVHINGATVQIGYGDDIDSTIKLVVSGIRKAEKYRLNPS